MEGTFQASCGVGWRDGRVKGTSRLEEPPVHRGACASLDTSNSGGGGGGGGRESLLPIALRTYLYLLECRYNWKPECP